MTEHAAITDDFRHRLQTLELSNLSHSTQLGALTTQVAVTVTRIDSLSKTLEEGIVKVSDLGEIISKWKGIAIAVMALGPLVGPLLTFLIRLYVYGAPPGR